MRRNVGLAFAGLAATVLIGGWAVPNIAGAVFVEVRAIATPELPDGVFPPTTGSDPLGTNGGAIPRVVVVGNEPAAHAHVLNISVEVRNNYPLPVVLSAQPLAFDAIVYRRENNGTLTRIWELGIGDASVEEGSDSPVGGGTGANAVVVPTGATVHDIAIGSAAFDMTDATGGPLPAGVYYLRTWAYGLTGPLLPLALDSPVN